MEITENGDFLYTGSYDRVKKFSVRDKKMIKDFGEAHSYMIRSISICY